MSDQRRRRQIKTPSGPRKKDTPDLSKYQMSPPPMGRQEVPKPQPKPDPSQQRSGGQRGGGGQRQGGRPGGRNLGGRGRGGRPGGRGQGRRDQPRPEPEAVKDESWGRVLEHDVKGGVATVMTEKTLVFCRVKVKGSDVMTVNQRIYIGKDRSKREAISAIIGMAHLDKMSNMAKQDLETVIEMYIEEHAQYFVEEFFNKAGYISMKKHAFTLLPGVNTATAQKMVDARNQVGIFASMAEFNSLTKKNGVELLKGRFIQEIHNPSMEPRLIELLLPVEA